MDESTEGLKFGVAKPCPVAWEQMDGDERVRHCRDCKTKVYNIAEMTRAEAKQLVEKHQGKVCIQIFQRDDGTVKTKDCTRPIPPVMAVRGLIDAFAHQKPRGVEPPRIIGRFLAPQKVASPGKTVSEQLRDNLPFRDRPPTAVELALAALVLVPMGMAIWWLLTR